MSASQTDGSAPDELSVKQAIEWMVRLHSGEATPADHQACSSWRAARPAHEQAWSRLQALTTRVQSLPSDLSHATLGDSPARRKYNRRFALKTLSIVCGVGSLAWGSQALLPWRSMLASYASDIGEQRQVTLADGTAVHLNTQTAFDADYSDSRRRIRLYRGELLITTAHDPASRYRPFIVETRFGDIQALGTEFRVWDQGTSVLVAVFEGAVEIRRQQPGEAVRLDAGQQTVFSAGGLLSRVNIVPADTDGIAWTEGMIVADRMRLGELVAQLDRYLPGRIRCDDAVADLWISGVFPLNQPAKVLAAVARTLPVKIDMLTSYWISLKPA
jgi:transmembrane sensor